MATIRKKRYYGVLKGKEAYDLYFYICFFFFLIFILTVCTRISLKKYVYLNIIEKEFFMKTIIIVEWVGKT
jgi:hypothetical protein